MVSTSSASGQRKFALDESEMPTHWYNLMADLPSPPPPPLHPGTHQPVGPEDLLPLFPIELIMQEVSAERYIEIPEAVRDALPAMAAVSPDPRPDLGAETRNSGADLLQVRRRVAGRIPQDQHGRAAGLLQLTPWRTSTHHGDRSRPVGHRLGLRLRALRHRVRGVAGRRIVRHQAPAQDADRSLRREGTSLTEPDDPVGFGVPRRPPRLARYRHLRGGRGRGPGRRHEVLVGLRPQSRPSPPDDHRPGGRAPTREGR